MACFVVPAAAAIVSTAVRKRIPLKYHISWLLMMLWGGVLMLLVDHMYTGELVLYPPFLTAGLDEMIPEIVNVGVPMTIVVFLMWGIMVFVHNRGAHKINAAADVKTS